MKEKYSCYEFEIRKCKPGFEYRIFGEGCMPFDDGVIESDKWYSTEYKARNAAIDKIDDLENP